MTRMRLVVVTTEEPTYIPKTFEGLFKTRLRESIRLVVILPPFSGKKTILDVARGQATLGVRYFLFRGFQYAMSKALPDPINRYSVEALARKNRIPVMKVADVNALGMIDTLRGMEPDLVISVMASQIFSKRLISIPRWAAINVHPGRLPEYRGLMSNFWVLLNREAETSVTVHLINEAIDGGEIVLEKSVPISEDETFHTLSNKTAKVSADAVYDAVCLFEEKGGKPATIPNPAAKGSYFSFPRFDDAREFEKRGLRIL